MVSTEVLHVHRSALRGHCYRMLGHPQDADDAVQETFERAINALEGFEGRASLRTWLVRIATNVCLDRLRHRKRRTLPGLLPPGSPDGPFEPTDSAEWLAPFPTAWSAPDALYERAQDLRLAMLLVLQRLPARQRAAWLLTQTWDLQASEVADALDCTVAAVNSALQRARAAMDGVSLSPGPTVGDAGVVERYVAAFEAFDVDALVELLADDIRFDMPPMPLWLRGREDVRSFFRGAGAECEGSVLVPTSANGLPALAQYRHGGRIPWALVVLEIEGDAIVAIHNFLDVAELFPLFDLPSIVESPTTR